MGARASRPHARMSAELERLLLAHARGEVLLIAGVGVSMPAKLPDFRCLVLLRCTKHWIRRCIPLFQSPNPQKKVLTPWTRNAMTTACISRICR